MEEDILNYIHQLSCFMGNSVCILNCRRGELRGGYDPLLKFMVGHKGTVPLATHCNYTPLVIY